MTLMNVSLVLHVMEGVLILPDLTHVSWMIVLRMKSGEMETVIHDVVMDKFLGMEAAIWIVTKEKKR